MTLTSAVKTILANMNEQLCYWTFNFRKVVRQFIWECSSERIIKIGQHLSEKWWKYEADVFLWNTL